MTRHRAEGLQEGPFAFEHANFALPAGVTGSEGMTLAGELCLHSSNSAKASTWLANTQGLIRLPCLFALIL
jgi:hypothetical protein